MPVTVPLLAVTVQLVPLLGAVNSPAVADRSAAGAPGERLLIRHRLTELVQGLGGELLRGPLRGRKARWAKRQCSSTSGSRSP